MTNVSLGGLEMEETEGAERDLMRFSKVERQFIAVASSMPFSPAGVDRARSSFGNPARRRELLGAARRYAKEHPVQAVAGGAAGVVLFPYSAAVLAATEISALARRRTEAKHNSLQGLRVLTVTESEARQLDLPHGHPRSGMIYAEHPLPSMSRSYFPVADFHQRVFEHKFAELLRMLTSLGATRIEVSASEGWSREVAAKIDLDLPVKRLDSKVEANRSQKRELLYRATLPDNSSHELPDDLTWYAFEETWKEVARQRLYHRLGNFHLQLSYRDDFGVTAEIAQSLTAAGFSLGGTFTRQVDTQWLLSGDFSKLS